MTTDDFDALLDQIKEDDRARVEAERHAQRECTATCRKLIAQDSSPRFARAAAWFAEDDVLRVTFAGSEEDSAVLVAVNQRDGRTYRLSYTYLPPSLQIRTTVKHPIGGRLELNDPRLLNVKTLTLGDIDTHLDDFLRFAVRGVGRQT
ncbi:MAG TPA: hypothetical protein VHQ90_22125 [Thermoanaerobaculia bacterium]|nr:hypothetical protein [Thermoanaerobaculia bacterium]